MRDKVSREVLLSGKWSHVRSLKAVRLSLVVAVAASLMVLANPGAAFGKQAPLPSFTRSNYAQLVNTPKKFKGAHVDISGKVFNIPPSGAKHVTAIQLYMDPDNYDWNTLVEFPTSLATVTNGDYVHVVGTVQGSYTYKTLGGGSDTAVLIIGTAVSETDQSATEPPIASTGVTLSGCNVDPDLGTLIDVTGSITNPSPVSYDYDITIEILSAGTRVGTAEEFETAVAPNQPTTWSTSTEITGDGTVTCQLLSVKRT